MNTNKTKKDVIAHLMAFLIALGVLALIVAVKLGYPETGTYYVENVERIWNLGAKEEGFYPDDCYYMVYTDGGVFKIELSGVNAYPYGLRLIGKDLPKTLRMKTRGARIEWLGLYPNIIEVVEEEEE